MTFYLLLNFLISFLINELGHNSKLNPDQYISCKTKQFLTKYSQLATILNNQENTKCISEEELESQTKW